MEDKQAITGAQAGLSMDDQIKIALQKMIDNGGQASMQEIYQEVEAQMNGNVLSTQGKASLRAFVSKRAVERGYVYAHDEKDPGRRITVKGQDYVQDNRTGEGVEKETLSDDLDELAIHKPYDPSQIRVEFTAFTVFHIMRKVDLHEIDLQPNLRHMVWDRIQQSRLIESILIRIPLPAFYLDAVDDDRWLVVDGLQRLWTLDNFFKNELRLKGLEFLHELEGKTFAELPRKFQRRIEETRLNFYIIQPDTPEEVKFAIFHRINTGGLSLNTQEIRHALFQGAATKLLDELADSPEFKSATANSIRPKRMDDRECVLRFLAFYLIPYTEYRNSYLDDFLNDTMRFINNQNAHKLLELQEIFLETMRKAEVVFGGYAFRKMYAVDGKRYPINKSLFEAWSVSLAAYSLETLHKHKDAIVAEFVRVMNEDSDFGKAISQGIGNVANVHKRFRTIEDILARIVK